MEFQVGDVVSLKSGGPEMTVESIESDGNVLCTWFDSNKRNKQRAIKREVLELVRQLLSS
jgi:uncharacterized protein YodC (DUF2158 family)